MDLALNGKTALVTGGSRGLGRQSALSLAAEGVNVAICGRTRQTLDIAVSEIEKNGVDAVGIEADVSDVKSMLNLHSEVESQLGPVDILVNNAGGSRARTDIAET
ncbi:MAG: SDR family NAD(P)-dependent oxidoreductase, partial [Chloroflexota bacterium]|nr:SDR family NAD(P)-dependent oxidoreductase [Chloroflexota bacterium]